MTKDVEIQIEEHHKQTQHTLVWTVIIFTFICTIVYFAPWYFQQQHTFYKTKIAALTKQVAVLEQTAIIKAGKLIEAEKIALDLERCLAETDNSSKHNAVDMEIYITKRYPAVAKELAKIISVSTDKLCIEYGMPFALIVGLMETESQFNPFAKSSVGARGLLQVMPNVWGKELELKESRELHGITVGIKGGLHVLRHYIEKNNGNVTKALKNYNGTNGDEFHMLVYRNVGRFTVYRSNAYQEQQLEVKSETERVTTSG